MNSQETNDLKYLKKHYGENFARLCRALFPTILEKPGMLSEIIKSKFAPTRCLYDEVKQQKDDFKNYIFSLYNLTVGHEERPPIAKTPKELLDEAGYILYDECQSEKDIQSFKKYYAKGEELCTFNGERLNRCRVWFAVKKNVDEIKRKDFKNPQRQDEYGTSVISIQFTRGEQSTLSIKNRYNHTVTNPDATFSNDLDNIIAGLTQAFIEQFNIDLVDSEAEPIYLDNFVQSLDGIYYKSNIEIDGVHFCENNVMVNNGFAKTFDPGRYVLMDNYLVDLKDNTIEDLSLRFSEKDSFITSIGDIEKIKLSRNESGEKVIVVTPKEGENVEITLSPSNEIIGYKNHNVTEIGNRFLHMNRTLKSIDIPSVKEIDKNFLILNCAIESLSLPNVEKIGHNFLKYNHILSSLNLPKVKYIGINFLASNQRLTSLDLPMVERIFSHFLYYNLELISLNMPKVKSITDGCLSNNKKLANLNAPNIETVGNYFLFSNNSIKRIDMKNLKFAGCGFLDENLVIEEINIDNEGVLDLGRVSKRVYDILTGKIKKERNEFQK